MLGFGRARFTDGRFDRRALLAPEIEVVAELHAKIGLAVPGEAEEFGRNESGFAETLALVLDIAVDA